jgi:hypothetical protein
MLQIDHGRLRTRVPHVVRLVGVPDQGDDLVPAL